ncbi:MAG: DUF4252 domain-containing protein [Paludibacter sp.]|jgi:hypothetical protein|nr:DUF4252 domain-containing protein [Paludibacter sp.]MEA4851795.1 DUF4252 domain-containing protein [Paludibacter sp.]
MKKMITIVVTLLLLSAATQAQTLQKFYDKYGDDERFQYVSVNKGMMNMASVFGGMAKDEKNMVGKMQGLKILTLDENADSPFAKAIVKELYQIIEGSNFETAVEVRDKGERVNIFYRVVGADNADMLVVTKDKSEFSCIWIKAKMTKDEISKVF